MIQPETSIPSSLRARFILYTSAVALTVFGLGVAAVVSVHLSTRALEDAIEDAMKEQYPVLHIEKLVQRAEMEAHDFLMYGNDVHRERYREASEEVNRAFEDLVHAPFDVEKEKVLAREAFERWKTATARLLTYARQAPGTDALSEMEIFDSDVERILAGLGNLLAHISGKIEGNLSKAYAVRMRLLFMVTVLFVICLGVVVLLGIRTARAILGPIRDLTEGVVQVGRGEYSERVPVSGKNELTILSEAFNTMAERLEQDRHVIERLTVRDSQTGLYNRRFFESILAEEIQLALRSRGVFSVLRLDIREFETIRTIHPEAVLLEILQSTASLIAGNIRVVDRGAYLGGGRFGIILRETSETGARTKAEALRGKLEAAGISPPHPPVTHLGLRIGVAAFTTDTETGDDLLRSAEADMEKER